MAEKIDYQFPESLTIQKVIPFNRELVKLFAKKRKTPIILDLRQLRSIDLAVLQVLAVHIKDCLENDRSVILKGPLDPLLQDSLEEMDMIRSGEECPVLFVQIHGGVKIEFQ